MMPSRIIVATLLGLAACSQPVQVPTEAEFEQNPALLKTWLERCRHGEYSKLGPEETQRICVSADAAAGAILQLQSGKDTDDTFANILTGK
jgi:hypothetical protein